MIQSTMITGHRSQAMEALVYLAAIVALVSGFGLLRLSASAESYMLMFLSFGLMVWGLLTLFTGSSRSWNG